MRVMLIGIDGMDHELATRWLGRLPTCRRLAREGTFRPLQSVFPPDSVPAWVSFYLGLEPGEHGVLQSIDYVNADRGTAPKNLSEKSAVAPTTAVFAERGMRLLTSRMGSKVSAFAGRTFWDAVGEAGKQVAVLNPFMAYPVWPVNGAMVSGPVFAEGEPQSYPAGLLDELPRAPLGGFVDFPSAAQLRSFAQATHALVARQAEQAVALSAHLNWDLCFVTFLSLDRVQHFFWRFHDQSDPTYPSDQLARSLGATILDHYRLLDTIVGRLLLRQPADCATVVLSDHGHGRRPTRAFHINEWLRRAGLLATRSGGSSPFSRIRLTELAKRAALQTAHRFELEDLAFAAAQLIPKGQRRSLQTSSFSVRDATSLARRDPFGGNSPSGGIRLNEPAICRAGFSVDAVRHSLIRSLGRVRDPQSGECIAEWVKPRDEVVSGSKADAFPQVLYQLKPRWGTDPSLFGPAFSDEPMHRRLSGGHRPTGVLFARGPDGPIRRPPFGLAQLRPWLLDLLGV